MKACLSTEKTTLISPEVSKRGSFEQCLHRRGAEIVFDDVLIVPWDSGATLQRRTHAALY